MTAQINGNYLEKYAIAYAELVCNQFFNGRQFITGQEIIQLTPSAQVNFFIIKRLFELWQEELGKLKSSPFFDYRDIAVHEALTQFMNVLSRRIKVERHHLEGIVQVAVQKSIQVATDPVTFYQHEVAKAPAGKINEYLKENKKYYKWNEKLVTSLIDKAGIGIEVASYCQAIEMNFKALEGSLDATPELMATLGETLVFDLVTYGGEEIGGQLAAEEKSSQVEEEEVEPIQGTLDTRSDQEDSSFPSTNEDANSPVSPPPTTQELDAVRLKALFATESYRGMKGILGELSESLALNQRFMFTKELFDGNADLLRHALKSIDEVATFEEAVALINGRFVVELGWNCESEEVLEFMQQVYRKFVS
uniref:hypothetical protein n=1 Tax=Algoriphagus sp. TaxID=1872435 RepID=UPI004048A9F9